MYLGIVILRLCEVELYCIFAIGDVGRNFKVRGELVEAIVKGKCVVLDEILFNNSSLRVIDVPVEFALQRVIGAGIVVSVIYGCIYLVSLSVCVVNL